MEHGDRDTVFGSAQKCKHRRLIWLKSVTSLISLSVEVLLTHSFIVAVAGQGS